MRSVVSARYPLNGSPTDAGNTCAATGKRGCAAGKQRPCAHDGCRGVQKTRTNAAGENNAMRSHGLDPHCSIVGGRNVQQRPYECVGFGGCADIPALLHLARAGPSGCPPHGMSHVILAISLSVMVHPSAVCAAFYWASTARYPAARRIHAPCAGASAAPGCRWWEALRDRCLRRGCGANRLPEEQGQG